MDSGSGLYRAEEAESWILPSPTPASDWAKANGQTELYRQCNGLFAAGDDQVQLTFQRRVREALTRFFGRSAASPKDVFLVGRNLESFDLRWLYTKGVLTKDDHHYRLYELTGAFQLIMDARGLSKEGVEKYLLLSCGSAIVPPEGNQHRALWDCYDQAMKLNGAILAARAGCKQVG